MGRSLDRPAWAAPLTGRREPSRSSSGHKPTMSRMRTRPCMRRAHSMNIAHLWRPREPQCYGRRGAAEQRRYLSLTEERFTEEVEFHKALDCLGRRQHGPRPPGLLPPPLPPGTKCTGIMRPFHRDCEQAHTSTPLKPQYRCLAQTRETQRTSTGRDNPALSSAAAVLSFCRHLTFPFASTPLPCTPLPCTVGTQEPPWPSTGGKHRCRRYLPIFPQHRCLHKHTSHIGLPRA